MVVWDRGTSWRQGHVLTDNAAIELKVITKEQIEHGAIGIIISHDCDVVRDPETEPNVEIIVGNRVKKCDGNYTHAKNSRKLHLSVTENGQSIFLELNSTNKKSIPKGDLVPYQPDGAFKLLPVNIAILQNWLAARYLRSGFPEEFNLRLQKTRLDERLGKIIKPLGEHLIAIYLDVDKGEEINRTGSDDPYVLEIRLLYYTQYDPLLAEEAANKAAVAIWKAFREECFFSDKNVWRHIELVLCEGISDQAMTIAESRMLKKWNLDYLSLRTEPTQAMFS